MVEQKCGRFGSGNLKLTIVLTFLAVFAFILLLSCKTVNKDKSDHIEYQLLKIFYDNSSGEKGLTTFNYNKNGRIMTANCNGLNGWFFGEIKYIHVYRSFQHLIIVDIQTQI